VDDSGCAFEDEVVVIHTTYFCYSSELFVIPATYFCHSRESGNPVLKEWIPNRVGDDSSNDIPHLMRNPGSISSSNMKRMNPF